MEINSQDLAVLSSMDRLESLGLRGASITDDDLKRLVGLPRLRQLVLARTKVTGIGVRYLKKLALLDTLNLADTPLGDKDLVSIPELPNLRDLSLMHTKITDAGIRRLYAIRQLRVLNVRATTVTQAALLAFRIARPDVEVFADRKNTTSDAH